MCYCRLEIKIPSRKSAAVSSGRAVDTDFQLRLKMSGFDFSAFSTKGAVVNLLFPLRREPAAAVVDFSGVAT